MKRMLSLLVLISLLFGCRSSGLLFNYDENLTIWVATDLHYMHDSMVTKSEYVHDLMLKSDGKLFKYAPEIVDAFVDKVQEEQPDVLILSGDISFNGEKTNHLELAKRLNSIQNNKTQVLVIPGNHDIDSNYPINMGDTASTFDEAVSQDEFVSIYNDFGYKQALSKSPADLSYLIQINPKLFILMLDDTQYELDESNQEDYNKGIIREETLDWIEDSLTTIKDAELIVVLHHNLLVHNPRVRLSSNLINGDQFKEVLNDKLNLVLSGHIHLQSITQAQEITEIVTSSLAIIGNQYGVIEYNPEQGFDYQVQSLDVQSWARDNQLEYEELLNFETFAFETMQYVNMRHSAFRLFDQGVEEDLALSLAEFDGYIKAFYFQGKFDQSSQELMELPQVKQYQKFDTQFNASSLKFMIDSADVNHRSIHVPLRGTGNEK